MVAQAELITRSCCCRELLCQAIAILLFPQRPKESQSRQTAKKAESSLTVLSPFFFFSFSSPFLSTFSFSCALHYTTHYTGDDDDDGDEPPLGYYFCFARNVRAVEHCCPLRGVVVVVVVLLLLLLLGLPIGADARRVIVAPMTGCCCWTQRGELAAATNGQLVH